MPESRAGAEREARSGNDNRTHKPTLPIHQAPVEPKKPGVRQRWNAIQTSKTAIFWIMVAVIALTMVIGFSWGGWVTGGSAQKTTSTAAQASVVQRLAPICVAQFNMDPDRETKLAELQGASSYQRSTYVKTQGWATMPGETAPDNRVAEACAKLLME
jgi:hypothetical protein